MPDETCQVVIVLAYNPDTETVDHDRIGTVETHPKAQARRMVATGEARWVDDPRNADDGYILPGETLAPNDDDTDTAPPTPLGAMTKTELRGKIPPPVLAELGTNPTRLELLAAARRAQGTGVPAFDAGGELPSGMTTVTNNTGEPEQVKPVRGQQ